MYDLTLGQVCEIVGGKLIGDSSIRVSGISIDSRSSASGDLFAAIVGDRVDGHDYIDQAFSNGASALLTSRQVDGAQVLVPESPDALDPVIHAIAKLSAHVIDARRRSDWHNRIIWQNLN